MTLADFPALNAALGGVSVIFVVLGWWAVRRQQELAHAGCLIVATMASVASLVGEGAVVGRQVAVVRSCPVALGCFYAALIVAHVVAALAWIVLATAAYVPVWQGRWNVHRRVGRLAMPVWLFAAVTGVVVNVMLSLLGNH